MRKLTLNPDELCVESFEPVAAPEGARGTVRALGGSAGTGCDPETAAVSCQTCDTAMGPTCDYLSCAGPYVTCRVPCTETYGDACCGGDG
jgi:hypothetical protein